MAANDFFSRWSKGKPAAGKTDNPAEQALAPASDTRDQAPASVEPLPPPTLEDVGKLTHESDFSRFVGRDVDEAVKRSALKKLFANPHFNVMDGLDIYIDDYTKFTPLTPTMLASLKHAKDLLNPPQAKKQELLTQDDKRAGQESSSAEADSNATASEAVQSDGGQQAASGDQDSPVSAAEQPSSSGSPDEVASPINVDDKPLSQGGS